MKAKKRKRIQQNAVNDIVKSNTKAALKRKQRKQYEDQQYN